MKHYGQYPVLKIIRIMNRLRVLIRSDGSEEIQKAWDEIEPIIDFFFQPQITEHEHKG